MRRGLSAPWRRCEISWRASPESLDLLTFLLLGLVFKFNSLWVNLGYAALGLTDNPLP